MGEVTAALVASLTCIAALALLGIAPFRDEFRSLPRRLAALVLWFLVLAFVVFLPVTAASSGEAVDPASVGFPWLFAGHMVLVLFLASWWWLRGDVTLADFLALRGFASWPQYFAVGLVVGMVAWAVTLAATGLLAGAWAHFSRVEVAAEIPPAVYWMAELPVWKKLVVIAVAMTVEEAFFRAFLQPRLGLSLASVFFALSHTSYGQPFLVVGVFIVSLFFGGLFARTGSLFAPMVAHGLFNGVQLFVVLPAIVRVFGTG
jgi:membrane protease YdiL (CAAX protease family)